jgi:hypothetical protein
MKLTTVAVGAVETVVIVAEVMPEEVKQEHADVTRDAKDVVLV